MFPLRRARLQQDGGGGIFRARTQRLARGFARLHRHGQHLLAKRCRNLKRPIPFAEDGKPLLEHERVPIMGGFIGSTKEGVTTTIGRGGSDFTAAIVGAGLGAEAH